MKQVQEVMDLIDELGDPKRGMSKEQWIEFLEQIEADCQSRREAAEEELRNGG